MPASRFSAASRALPGVGPRVGLPAGKAATAGSHALVRVFALTIFLSAFLVFQVQPLIAKFILPWFGGGTGVWTVCVLFFQVCLLAGYAYAHGIARFLSLRGQALVHVGLLVAALMFLPIVPGVRWKPGVGQNPTWAILLLLTVCLGLPYFILASTGPLLQAWFSRVHPHSGASPYRLYALSNAGSLLALVSYPFIFEPLLTRGAQASFWSWGFGLFVALCGACAWQICRVRPKDCPSSAAPAAEPTERFTAPTLEARTCWFGLAACGSTLLLATTNKLCLDVASVPFLWILPLSLYLLTFAICFDRPAWYSRKIFTLLLVPLLAMLCYNLYKGPNVTLGWQTIVLAGCLFCGCMFCHGEVYRLKPAPRFLTSFYLYVAAGGAAGGIFVGLISPLIFRSYAELSWGYWFLAELICFILLRDRTTIEWRNRRWPVWPVCLLGLAVLGGALLFHERLLARVTISTSRSFYGVLRVSEAGVGTPFHAHKLNHGVISHGLQFAEPAFAAIPTSYYNEASGVGAALTQFPRQSDRRVGVVGLGVGTLAAYGHPGDTFRFYEINPEVERIAKSEFSFLRNSSARVEIVLGDARLSLERESDQQFDVVVLDAFSSDAVPVHLLTLEAFETYFRHMKSDGIIAVHISNHHLNMLPVLTGAARRFDRMMMCLDYDDKERPWWFSSSRWVILTSNRQVVQSLMARATLIPERDCDHPLYWTDDHASLLGTVRF